MGVNRWHVVMAGADISSLGTLYLPEDGAADDEEWEEIDNHNTMLFDKYGVRQAAKGGRFIHCLDCYGSRYEMFGRALAVTDNERWDVANLPLAHYELKDEDVREAREELKKLLPGRKEEIDKLEFRLWVFTHCS